MSASLHHPHTYTFREQYSRSILDQYYGRIIPGLSLDTFTPYDVAHSSVNRRNASTVSTSKVGIIGAGVAGLYAAMVLQNLGVQYEILEAQPSHIGGRLYTHHFSDGPNDYYDVGAMRFPNISPMWRTFDLFHRLNFSGKYVYDKNKLQQLSNSTSSRDAGQALATYEALIANVTFTNSSTPAGTDVIDYILSTPEDIQHFNGVSIRRKDSQAAGINSFNTGGIIPESYLSKGVQYWLDAKVGYFRDQLRRNFTSGLDELRQYDAYSTRQLMRTKLPELEGKFTEFMKETYPGQNYTGDVAYPEEVINWIETFSSGTSMYDDALSETVFDELDFNYAPNVTWKAIQGGSHRIALAMVQQLRDAENPRGQILQNKRVTKISPATSNGNQSSGPISVYVEGEATPRQYDHVISTVALSALRMIDLDDCELSWQLRESLRELEYGASVKVGIRFTHRWWEQQGQDHRGGISSTDRLSRQIVYPSYGIGSNDATMLASYSWSQDALRLGALVKGKDSLTERRLVDQLLQDLSKVHNITYEDLKSWMVDYHAYSWYHNEYTIGAFALFGPAQFGRMYQAITQPAGNVHLHFAGEAASTNHGWVAGALDSVIRSITQVFYQDGRHDLVDKLQAEWGLVDEMSPEHAMKQVALSQNTGMTASNTRR